MSTNLLILGGSATKHPDTDLLPALDRYDGPAFRVLRKALRERPGLAERLKICIISAAYGLISADYPILWYEQRMNRDQALFIRPKVEAQAIALLGDHRWPGLVMCGNRYHVAMPAFLWHSGMVCTFGGIGYQLGQLKAWLWRNEL